VPFPDTAPVALEIDRLSSHRQSEQHRTVQPHVVARVVPGREPFVAVLDYMI
jgi:hypothetical protein